MMIRTTACVIPTRFSLPTADFNIWNMLFPATPPAAAPIASPVAVRTLSFADFARIFLYTETTDIASTVHPDRKLILLTLMTPTASSTGLMITPPPIPQIEPAIEDRILTAKNTHTITIKPLPSLLHTSAVIPLTFYYILFFCLLLAFHCLLLYLSCLFLTVRNRRASARRAHIRTAASWDRQ